MAFCVFDSLCGEGQCNHGNHYLSQLIRLVSSLLVCFTNQCTKPFKVRVPPTASADYVWTLRVCQSRNWRSSSVKSWLIGMLFSSHRKWLRMVMMYVFLGTERRVWILSAATWMYFTSEPGAEINKQPLNTSGVCWQLGGSDLQSQKIKITWASVEFIRWSVKDLLQRNGRNPNTYLTTAPPTYRQHTWSENKQEW